MHRFEKWRDALPQENAEYKGALKIRSSDSHTETIPLTFKITTGPTNWQTIYEAAATAKTQSAGALGGPHRLAIEPPTSFGTR